MTTRAELEAKVAEVEDENLEVLYRLVLSLVPSEKGEVLPEQSWTDFVSSHFGCLADAPIERGEQGQVEIRDPLR